MSELKKTSFQIGSGTPLECVTETHNQFAHPNSSGGSAVNKELRNYLKGHHFELGVKGSHTVKNSQMKTYDGSGGQTRAEKENQAQFKND